MSFRTLIFVAAFFTCCGGALFLPLIGILGYILDYHLSPGAQWWEAAISGYGLRYSFMLAAFTAIGIAIHHRSLRYGDRLLTPHEWLMLGFVAVVFLSTLIGVPAAEEASAAEPGPEVDPPEIKMLKVLIFTLMLTHVATSVKDLRFVLWAICLGVLFLGYKAFTAGSGAFATGRLNIIGGPDFGEANGLGSYFAACLPVIALLFLRSGWKGKVVALSSGVLAVNGLVLCRSRGAFVALAGGMIAAVLMAPKQYRKVVLVGLLVVAIGGYALTDPGFWERTSTITTSTEQMDTSAYSRIAIWRGSLSLLADHPLGIGADNFTDVIGQYVPAFSGKDAHNSYVLCWSELGLHGILIYLAVIVSAARLLWLVHKRSRQLPARCGDELTWISYVIAVSLAIWLLSGMTISRLYNEGPWWFLAMPVCLWRAVENAEEKAAQRIGATAAEADSGKSGLLPVR